MPLPQGKNTKALSTRYPPDGKHPPTHTVSMCIGPESLVAYLTWLYVPKAPFLPLLRAALAEALGSISALQKDTRISPQLLAQGRPQRRRDIQPKPPLDQVKFSSITAVTWALCTHTGHIAASAQSQVQATSPERHPQGTEEPQVRLSFLEGEQPALNTPNSPALLRLGSCLA